MPHCLWSMKTRTGTAKNSPILLSTASVIFSWFQGYVIEAGRTMQFANLTEYFWVPQHAYKSQKFHQLKKQIANEKLQHFHLQILTFFLQNKDKAGFANPVLSSTKAVLILSMPHGYVWKNEQAEIYWQDLKNPESNILPVERKRSRGGSWILPMKLFPPNDESNYLSTYWLW